MLLYGHDDGNNADDDNAPDIGATTSTPADPGSVHALQEDQHGGHSVPDFAEEPGTADMFLNERPTDEPEDLGVPAILHIKELQVAQQFIDALKAASLDTSGLHPECLKRLRNPPQETLNINSESLRLSLEVYTHIDHTSEEVYKSFRRAVAKFPDNVQLVSLDQVKRYVQEISGIWPILADMCINSCVGFTGPFSGLDKCPECNAARYETQASSRHCTSNPKPRKQFLTNPIGPQVQAAWRSPESARAMCYRKQCQEKILADLREGGVEVAEISDWVHGTEAIDASSSGDMNKDSTVLMLSFDGAQLYRSKQSDCWIYIWVLLDRGPDSRYKKKHVLVGAVIPGPKKPKNVDSFLFPGLQHVAALMKEGLSIWDAAEERLFWSYLFLAYVTADGPGMQFINGLVGHSGRYGCRLYCPMRGRHKPGSGHYFPACMKPFHYDIEGSNHGDISIRFPDPEQDNVVTRYRRNLYRVQGSSGNGQYEKNRLETGIAKPSLVSGLPSKCRFEVPKCFPADIMHLVALNIPELLLGLWRATLKCDNGDTKDSWDWAILRDNATWKRHGKQVAATTPYLPGSFDRPPRNPAEKLNSSYKAIEFLHYIFELGPALFYGLLPLSYWQNFCRLVKGIRLIHQRNITMAQLREAHKQLILFMEEFELLYYQRRPERIHFIRQSIHALRHLAEETIRIGPYGILAQWAMERAIGDLGGEIRQTSNPYANLAQRALRRCQINALKHMLPSLDRDEDFLPGGAVDLGDGFILRGQDEKSRPLQPCEAEAVKTLMQQLHVQQSDSWMASPVLRRWARLRLPSGQIARCLWKEGARELNDVRMSRNVKVSRRLFFTILSSSHIVVASDQR